MRERKKEEENTGLGFIVHQREEHMLCLRQRVGLLRILIREVDSVQDKKYLKIKKGFEE